MAEDPGVIDPRSLSVAGPRQAAAAKEAAGLDTKAVPVDKAAATAALAETQQSTKPGKERWPVKTGTDQDVSKIKQLAVPITVEEMNRLPRPAGMKDATKDFPAFQAHRASPTETTIWRVQCEIIGLKLEADGDYHLVLRGVSGEMMIGEIPTPDPPFVQASSPFVAGIRAARMAIDGKFKNQIAALRMAAMSDPSKGANAKSKPVLVPVDAFSGPTPLAATKATDGMPEATFKVGVKPTKVTLTGVGFFDRVHGQTGVAPNGIELHPILAVKFG